MSLIGNISDENSVGPFLIARPAGHVVLDAVRKLDALKYQKPLWLQLVDL